ncbi:MAG: glycoside hydrolase family 15 protein [Anaerolineae bacterium]|nr:glycoside hydrolase family 15 protein [Anaerolineae bacterium]
MNLYNTSLNIITAGQAPSGAYVASPTFSQYGYAWLRDGAWIAYGMDCAGQHASARAFYAWVGRTLAGQFDHLERLLRKLERDDTPSDADYLPTRFTLDGKINRDDWWNFQLDGYGTWLWGLVAHVDMTGDRALWADLEPAITLTVRYLTALWQSPNYDCWEENREQIHLSTLAALYGGLNAVRRYNPALVPDDLPANIRAFVLEMGVAPEGHLMKYLGNSAVDASLLWTAVPYGLVDLADKRFTRTLAKIERDLLRPDGGVYRYADDVYYGGGEWILLSAWLAWVYIELGRTAEARDLVAWIEAQATPDGALPEQVNDHLLHPEHYAEWVARWGAVASPLLWSHGMVLVVKSLLDKRT